MKVRRLGKFAVLTSIAALAISTVVATPSFAANKANAVCPKANATATISGEKYICTKNPYTVETKKTAKLTWTIVACVDAHKNPLFVSLQAHNHRCHLLKIRYYRLLLHKPSDKIHVVPAHQRNQ